MILFHQPLTADQLQYLREALAAPVPRPAPRRPLRSAFLSVEASFQARPVLTGVLIFLNGIVVISLINLLLR